ncbi:hypothetical protein SAMN04487944_10144 [Gracilibacillus ureilyticus]|uniref:Uncharacterized protein n=1 Tax=Gracilibacillus ureilyticus TaxID=531814 RepID=A0A1H9L0I8_9BACI|nr:hypothetical protein [Gracilibacillus ureilyticus]SER04906.1 hypothetical protein SAMN04487944_10144 [Gracilibacillus ureilyticus]
MSYWVSYVIAILLTSMSYYIGSKILKMNLGIVQSLIIGTTVVSLGVLTEYSGAPIWLIVLVPFPAGMILSFLFLKTSFLKWLRTYMFILFLYTIIHIIVSYFFQFHSLIPAWHLS